MSDREGWWLVLPEDVDPQITDPQAVEEKGDAEIRNQSATGPAGGAAASTPAAGVSTVSETVVHDHVADDDNAGKQTDTAATDHSDQVAEQLAPDAARPEAAPDVKHWAQLGRLTTEDGSWFVERTWPAQQTDAGKIPVRPFVGPAVYVRCQYGLTLNLGRYESARIDVSLSVPCYPAEVAETYDYVSKWVSERVLQERAEIDAYRQQNSGESSVSQG